MTTTLNTLVAGEHTADLRRAAERYRAGKPEAARGPKVIGLRLAEPDDARALKVLAELDEEPELCGEALLVLFDGEAVAAISLSDGRVVANPFVATGAAVALLRFRAHHLFGVAVGQPRRRWRLALYKAGRASARSVTTPRRAAISR